MFAPTRYLPALFVTLLLALALAACGRSADAMAGPGGAAHQHATQQIEIRADPGGRLAWERIEYSATAGDLTFIIWNPASLPHNVIITGNGIQAQSAIIQGGASGALTLSGLPPGTYQLACSLPGHRESGMIATLLVHEKRFQ